MVTLVVVLPAVVVVLLLLAPTGLVLLSPPTDLPHQTPPFASGLPWPPLPYYPHTWIFGPFVSG